MVGVITMLVPVKDPGIQVYVVAPLPVNVAELPEQTAVDVVAIFTVGLGFTINEIVRVFVQIPLVPLTVYVVVVVGVTIILFPVIEAGNQVYVVAPLAVRVAEFPKQTAVGVLMMLMVGLGLTIKFTVRVELHNPLNPVTVYVVVLVGLTVTVPPVNDPGIHVNEVAPLALKVELDPEQIFVGEALAVTVGLLFTVIEIVFVEVQPELSPVTE